MAALNSRSNPDTSQEAGVRLIIPSLRMGGAERVCSHLANWWAAAGDDVELVLVHSDGEFRRQLDHRVTVREFPVGRVAKALLPVANHINRSPDRATLVFGLDFGAGLGVLRRFGLLRKPFVYREGSSPEHKHANFWYRAGIDFADGVVVQTRFAERVLTAIGVRRPRYRLIPNPLIPPAVPTRVSLRKSGTLRMLAIGRLEPVKGYERMLDAIRRLQGGGFPTVSLTIMGHGSQELSLRRRIKEWGLEGVVELRSQVADISAACANYDLFVMASWYEGMPNALLEALSCGLRVVAPDIPSIRELMGGLNLEDCLVPNHRFAELALGVVRHVLTQPDGRWDEARRATVERFGIARVAHSYLAFCRAVHLARAPVV